MENRHFQINSALAPVPAAQIRLGALVLGLLMLAAGYFYQIKICFSDPAFQLFELISKDELVVQAGRFGAIPTQLMGLGLLRMGLSLPVFLVCFCMGFLLLHLLGYWFLAKYEPRAALIIPFYYLAFSSDLLYWTVSEHQQAMVYLIVWFAFLYKTKEEPISVGFFLKRLPVHLFGLIWVVFLYPSSILTAAFAVGFCFVSAADGRIWSLKRIGWLLAMLGILYLVFWLKTKKFASEYDLNKLGDLLKGWEKMQKDGMLASTKAFLQNCLADYLPFALLYLLSLGFYLFYRQWCKFLLLLSAVPALALLVQVTVYNGADKFYIDNMYLPLGFMLALPILYDVLPQPRFAKYAFYLLLLFFSVRMLQTLLNSRFYQSRLDYVAHLVESSRKKYPDYQCFVTPKSDVDERKLMVSWSVAYETLFYTALNSPDGVRTLLIVDNPADMEKVQQIRGHFASPWGNMDIAATPIFARYFPIKNTEYQPLGKEDFGR